jgi:uncharacterized membrane protein
MYMQFATTLFLADASTLGKMHLQILHFPIALAMMAAVADLLWLIRRKGRFAPAFKASGTFLIVAAAILAIPTVIAGDSLMEDFYTGKVSGVVQWHANLGIITMCVLILAAGLRLVLVNRGTKWWPWVHGLLIVCAVGLVTVTAHLGGMLAWSDLFPVPSFLKWLAGPGGAPWC